MIATLIRRHFLVVLLVLSLAVFLVLHQMAATKRLKEAEVADIQAQINSGAGASGLDLKTLVHNITPTAGYNGKVAAQAIHDAHGYLFDDEAAVFLAFQNKSIGQIAAIVAAFQALFGLDLDGFLHNGSYLSEFLSLAQYQQVVGIVQAARSAARL